jgi:hypothetical protein
MSRRTVFYVPWPLVAATCGLVLPFVMLWHAFKFLKWFYSPNERTRAWMAAVHNWAAARWGDPSAPHWDPDLEHHWDPDLEHHFPAKGRW